MELNNTPINYKHITNFTAISVKIKPVPSCLAERGPKANWIFSAVFAIFLEEPSESAPGEDPGRAAAWLTALSGMPESQTRFWGGRKRPAGFQHRGREENNVHSAYLRARVGGQWELDGFVPSVGARKGTEDSSEYWY